jgi:hypothetical protein
MMDVKPVCIYCGNGTEQAPLILFKFHDQDYWICAQHFPVLIHEPAKLVGKLPGAEKLKGGSHE